MRACQFAVPFSDSRSCFKICRIGKVAGVVVNREQEKFASAHDFRRRLDITCSSMPIRWPSGYERRRQAQKVPRREWRLLEICRNKHYDNQYKAYLRFNGRTLQRESS